MLPSALLQLVASLLHQLLQVLLLTILLAMGPWVETLFQLVVAVTLTNICSSQCVDSSGKEYNFVSTYGSFDQNTCAQYCQKLPSPDLVGFDLQPGRCQCNYSGSNVPTPPSGFDWQQIDNNNSGAGPIKGTKPKPLLDYQCYAFSQVRHIVSFIFTALLFLNHSNVITGYWESNYFSFSFSKCQPI